MNLPMGPSSEQIINPLRRRLRWWLLILLALAGITLAALWPSEAHREVRIFGVCAVTLLMLGILVDQTLLAPPSNRHDSTTRDALLELNQRLLLQANTDALTGLYNRRGLESFFQELVSTQRFSHQPIAVLMIDLDEFKMLNDLHGHLIGDQILRHAAELLQNSLRRSDGLCRWGGDEICVMLPNTALSQAVSVARKLCRQIAEHPFEAQDMQETLRITLRASIGVVAVDIARGADMNALLAGADQALYQAKAAGGNTAIGIRLD